jgi:hypothetical protein
MIVKSEANPSMRCLRDCAARVSGQDEEEMKSWIWNVNGGGGRIV